MVIIFIGREKNYLECNSNQYVKLLWFGHSVQTSFLISLPNFLLRLTGSLCGKIVIRTLRSRCISISCKPMLIMKRFMSHMKTWPKLGGRRLAVCNCEKCCGSFTETHSDKQSCDWYTPPPYTGCYLVRYDRSATGCDKQKDSPLTKFWYMCQTSSMIVT